MKKMLLLFAGLTTFVVLMLIVTPSVSAANCSTTSNTEITSVKSGGGIHENNPASRNAQRHGKQAGKRGHCRGVDK